MAGPDAAELDLIAPEMTPIEKGGLAAALGPFEEERGAVRPLILMAAISVGTMAGIVLLMAAGLQAARRREGFTLLRARGAGVSGLIGRLLGETSAVAVPSSAAGTLLAVVAVVAVPTPHHLAPVLSGLLVATVASLALPARAVALGLAPRPAQREDLVTVRPSGRRTVAEITVAVLLLGSVVALRRRGTADGDADALVAAAPVLLAVVAALVLLRVYPLPLRLVARPVSRLRGTVLPLAVARAGRTASVTVLPLMALLVVPAVTSFGGSVISSVDAGRERAAMWQVGADARIDARIAVPEDLTRRLREVSGVRATTAVRFEAPQQSSGGRPFTVIVVEPRQYAELTAAAGIGEAFPAAAMTGDDDPLPTVVSPSLGREFAERVTTVRTSLGATRIRAVAVRDATPAVPAGDFVAISTTGLAHAHPEAAPAAVPPPMSLYVSGPALDADALRAAVRAASPELRLTLRSAPRVAPRSSPLRTRVSPRTPRCRR